jgi:hypothetical protein
LDGFGIWGIGDWGFSLSGLKGGVAAVLGFLGLLGYLGMGWMDDDRVCGVGGAIFIPNYGLG